MLLGDMLENALSTVGASKSMVETWLGRPCGCEERQFKLNQLHLWAKRIMLGKLDRAQEFLDRIISE